MALLSVDAAFRTEGPKLPDLLPSKRGPVLRYGRCESSSQGTLTIFTSGLLSRGSPTEMMALE